jgi:hypothetical protein
MTRLQQWKKTAHEVEEDARRTLQERDRELADLRSRLRTAMSVVS